MSNTKQSEPKPFDQFKDLTRKLLAVPKKEIDRREAVYQRQKAKKRRSA